MSSRGCRLRACQPLREKANANPGYHVKDKRENKLHGLVCSGSMPLHAAQSEFAGNWQALYKREFGMAP
jgi:hypothetical protein